MNESVSLDGLPALPQVAFLRQLVPSLWARSDVAALWLEGSLGRGNADHYSDVDLYVAVDDDLHADWLDLDVAALFGDSYAAHHFSRFADDFFVYHVYLTAGVIYDLHIQPRQRPLRAANRLILACRSERYRAELLQAVPAAGDNPSHIPEPEAVDPAIIRPLLVGFWLNADKSRKVIYRGQQLTCYTGLHLFRQMLARLLYIDATGTDCGDLSRPTIHGLKAAAALLGPAMGAEMGRLFGAPARTLDELWQAQEQLHRAVARVGRSLAATYEIDYPAALEEVVLDNWATFRATEIEVA